MKTTRARYFQLLVAILLALAPIAVLGLLAGNAHPTAAATVRYASAAAVRASGVLTPAAYFPVIFKPWPSCGAPPCLLSPQNGEKITTLAPLFVWNAGPSSDIQYWTEFSLQPEWFGLCGHGLPCPYPGSNVVSVREPGIFRPPYQDIRPANLQPGTTYSWGIKRCNPDQCQQSPIWTFTTPATVTLPSAPAIITPTSGSVVPGPLVEFEWSPVEGALDYDFCLDFSESSPYPQNCMWLGSTQTSLQVDLYGPMPWYWQVAALGAQGEGPGLTVTFQVSETLSSPRASGPLPAWSIDTRPAKARTLSAAP